jgi:hypothetical protein
MRQPTDADRPIAHLILGPSHAAKHSRSDTYPYIKIEEEIVSVGHEASISKIGEVQPSIP